MSRLYAWHRAALAGENPPSHDGDVQCGYYMMRGRDRSWLPVHIYVDRDIDPETGELTAPEVFRCKVGEKDGGDPVYLWTWLRPISYRAFKRLTAFQKARDNLFDQWSDYRETYFRAKLGEKQPWFAERQIEFFCVDPDTGEIVDAVSFFDSDGIRKDAPPTVHKREKISREAYQHLLDYCLRDSRMLDARGRIDLSDRPTPPQGVF